MKLILLILLTLPAFANAQFGNNDIPPASFQIDSEYSNVKTEILERPPLKNVNDKPYLKVAEGYPANFKFSDFALDHIKPNGDKIYQLSFESNGIDGMMFQLDNLTIHDSSKLWVINPTNHEYVGAYTKKDIDSNHQLITSALIGNKLLIEFLEPVNYSGSYFEIKKVYYYFPETLLPVKNNILECMQEMACNQNQVYANIKDAICKIVMITNNSIGNCTGTLINNARGDGKLYLLTANHCAETNEQSTFAKWEFHLNYEKNGCDGRSSSGPTILKGAELVSRSSPLYSNYESDFLLLRLTAKIPDNINPLLLGWNTSESMTDSGACIHHPYGEPKKISYYTSPPVKSFKSPLTQDYTHLKVTWSMANTNKISVTYGGSSGSCLVNSQGQIIGTLTGGFSSCQNATGNDFYGRMAYHWDQNKGNDSFKLNKWLDPDGKGITNINQIQYKNTTSYLGITSITSTMNPLNNIEYSIANKILNIKWNMPMFTVNLYDLLGQLVMSTRAYSQAVEMDLHHINSGLYILETVSNDKRNVKKFYF